MFHTYVEEPVATEFEFELMDTAAVTTQGQVTIPKRARDASRIGESCRVLIFVDREHGYVLLTHEPLVDELLEAAAKAARRKRSS